MTTILVRKTEGGYQGFTCTGHSGFAESGSDIVCAGISVLVINTINALEALAGAQMQVIAEEEDGVIDVVFQRATDEKANLLMDALILGLTSMQQQYGKKYLKLKFEEV